MRTYDLEGDILACIKVLFQHLPVAMLRKITKESFRMASILQKIQIRHLLKTNLECYCYESLCCLQSLFKKLPMPVQL